jgi:DNA transformation protein
LSHRIDLGVATASPPVKRRLWAPVFRFRENRDDTVGMTGFADFVQELLEGLGPVRIRRMFGGAGVYAGDVMFGLIDADVLYLKTDEALRGELAAQGSVGWVYSRAPGKWEETSYWRLPESALDDPDEAVAWARKALAVAQARAAENPKKRKKRAPVVL